MAKIANRQKTKRAGVSGTSAGTWRPLGFLAALLAICSLLTAAPRATYRHHGNVLLPDPAITPGDIRTTNQDEICDPKFRTSKYRVITKNRSALKQICAVYGVADCPKRNVVELDDLLPVELGGANTRPNVWVQPGPEFHWKDDLENKLKAKVCKTHELTLLEAQRCILTDWAACYEKQIGPLPDELPKGTSGAK